MNIIEYAAQNHNTFAEKPFGDIDSLILCQLFYAKMEDVLDGEGLSRTETGYTVKDFNKAEYFGSMFNDSITDEKNKELSTVCYASRRYRDIKVKNLYDDTNNNDDAAKQFAAVAFEIDDETDYVCYRGTDGDMLGWEEDFDLAYKRVIPSQKSAVRYIEHFYGPGTEGETKKLIIGGHSKGGNLAVFGGIMCCDSIRDRVVKIYSHDGPGFRSETMHEIEERLKEKPVAICRQIPHASIVGMLLKSQIPCTVVKASAVGIMQHAAFTWEIEGDAFVEVDDVSESSRFIDGTLTQWLKSSTDEEKELAVGLLFGFLKSQGIHTVQDMRNMRPRQIKALRDAIQGLDEDTRGIVDGLVKSLFRAAFDEMVPDFLKREEDNNIE